MRFLTAGESHGEALSVVISEYPSGIKIDTDFINSELSRRQMGFGRGVRMSIENDEVRILSGLRKKVTTGSPISFLIYNNDFINWKEKLEKEEDISNPRPGHADLTGVIKYRLDSIRDIIERSSARETASRVAVGALAKLFLRNFDIFVLSYVEQIGNIRINEQLYRQKISRNFNPEKNKSDSLFLGKIENSILRCPDENASVKMAALVKKTVKEGDTLGGAVRVFTSNLIAGLGSFIQWDMRLDARIAAAVMSIPSVKAVSFGSGNSAGFAKGTEFHDEIFYDKKTGFCRNSNNAGGIEGGMTNGENIDVKAVIKPIPTTLKGLKTVDIKTKKASVSHKERADVCAVPSIAVIAESMVAIEIFNSMQEKFGKDSISEILDNYNNYRKYIENI